MKIFATKSPGLRVELVEKGTGVEYLLVGEIMEEFVLDRSKSASD